MESPSVWQDKVTTTIFPKLSADISVDVAIIGGGITGITAAYLLAKKGKKVAVLEARSIGKGSTGYSTGNLYAIPGTEGLHTVQQKWGKAHAKQVVESRAAAIDFIEARVQEFKINCDFVRIPFCLFSENGENALHITNERQAAEEAGLTTSDYIPAEVKVQVGFSIPNQAQFNPLQYTAFLAKSIQSDLCQIYEDTPVLDYEDGKTCTVTTPNGKVTADSIIMATHTPKGLYMVHAAMEVYREYAVAMAVKGNYPPAGTFWDMKMMQHYSYRTYDTSKGKVLMVLGQKHKVGLEEHNEPRLENLKRFLRERFDLGEVVYEWAAQQYRPADAIPYIGKSTGSTNTYIATGFSADGLTYGTLAAMIIADQICKVPNLWSETYKASRITPVASATKFIRENITVGYELVKDFFFKKDAKYMAQVIHGEGKVMEVEGKRCAVTRDKDGNLTVLSAICPHMGCIVHWNDAENSWDCPCHGSRFESNGAVIEGPALHPLQKIDEPVEQ